MITVNFCKCEKEKDVSGLWQYDYGQILRIQGLNLPTAVEIHFSMQSKSGDSVTRVGVTRDGVTDVVIPDSMLENNDINIDYSIYAFIYLTDETSGETAYKICMRVRSRSKPEAFDTPEDAELFRDAIAAVNEAADRAETAESNAEQSEKDAAGHLENTGILARKVAEDKTQITAMKEQVADNAKAVKDNTDKVATNTSEVAVNKERVERLTQETAANAQQVTGDKMQITAMKEQVSTNAKAVKDNTDKVASDAEAVAENKKQVEEKTSLTEEKAAQVSENTAKVESLTEKAEAYMEAAKRNVQSDLSINDETDPGYVKGRTHWSEGEQLVDIITETTFEGVEVEQIYTQPLGLKVGGTYIVKINGVIYENVAVEADFMGIGRNQIFVTDNIGDIGNCKYGLIEVPGGIDGVYAMLNVTPDGSTSHTVSVSCKSEVIHKLDNKYLDLDWLPIRKNEVDVVLEEKTLNYNTTATTSQKQTKGFHLEDGKKYVVYWKGAPYECTAKGYVVSGNGYDAYLVVLGNAAVVGTSSTSFDVIDTSIDSGEPFGIVNMYMLESDVYDLTYFVRNETGQSEDITVKIECNNEILNTLPKEYLPSSVIKAPSTAEVGQALVVKAVDENGKPIEWRAADVHLPESVDSVILLSSTADSTKLFKLTVDDTGTITATEITE